MSREDYPYDEDEFDVLGADRTPQGVHRAPVPRWRQLLPFAIVIVVAPLLAWAGVSALSGEFGADPQETPPAATETVPGEDEDDPEETEPEEGNGTEDPEENGTEDDDGNGTEEESPADEADLDREVRVLILNGTSTVGLASTASETLMAEGWTNTSTADYGQAQPAVTTLYYHDALVAEEAEAVAADLGIEETVESASAASTGVVIVLRDDFTD